MQLPEKFLSVMKERLGNEYDDYIKSLDEPRHYGLRANTLKISAERLSALLGLSGESVKWCPDGLYYDEVTRPAKTPYFHAGLFYIQEPSAMSTAGIINIRPGDRVLDICAAPGGKSTQAGARLNNTGLLVSNDISATRLKALVKNIELAGIRNAAVVNERPSRLTAVFSGFFDKIIIDAPCSGEGMFRKDSEAVRSWAEYRPSECSAMQREILFHSAKMLRTGGEIAYSTCTFSAEENEGMIDWFLNTCTDFEILPIDHESNGLAPGRPEWGGGRRELTRCGRIWPHKAKGEGHFLCLLKKNGGDRMVCDPVSTNCRKPMRIDGMEDFHSFCREVLNEGIDGAFIRRGSALYLEPAGLPDLSGLRVARSGWYLGDFRTKRFEPSQALVMGLVRDAFTRVLNFSADSPEVIRYLKGESFPVDEADGWIPVCVEGFSLGWGKIVQGRMKNKYAKGWRLD